MLKDSIINILLSPTRLIPLDYCLKGKLYFRKNVHPLKSCYLLSICFSGYCFPIYDPIMALSSKYFSFFYFFSNLICKLKLIRTSIITIKHRRHVYHMSLCHIWKDKNILLIAKIKVQKDLIMLEQ